MARDEPSLLLATCSYEFTEDVYESLCRAKKKQAAYKLLPKLLLFLVMLFLSCVCVVVCVSYMVEYLHLGADDFFDQLIYSLLFAGMTIVVVLLTVKCARDVYDCLYTIFVGRPRPWPASLDHEGPEEFLEYRTFLVKVKVDYDGIDIWYIPREGTDSKNARSARKLFWSGPKKGPERGSGKVGWDRVMKIDDLVVVLGDETTDSNKGGSLRRSPVGVVLGNETTDSKKGQGTIWDAIILENAVMPASRLRGTSADDLHHEIKDRIKWAKNRRRWTSNPGD